MQIVACRPPADKFPGVVCCILATHVSLVVAAVAGVVTDEVASRTHSTTAVAVAVEFSDVFAVSSFLKQVMSFKDDVVGGRTGASASMRARFDPLSHDLDKMANLSWSGEFCNVMK
jgi:hypothetical protein